MKVKDLIKELEKLDGEKTIGKENEESDFCYDKDIEILSDISYNGKFNYLIY